MSIDIPTRTTRSKYAKSYLFENNIYFFIEDTDKNTIKIILELIQRTISPKIKVNRLYPLGGRSAVLEKFEQKSRSRKEIYIIDGDLYLLFSQNIFQKGLVILKRYCIENYLLDPHAIHELLYEECSNTNNKEQIIKLFSFGSWFKKQDKLLSTLFIEYAVEKKNQLGIQTVKYSVEQLQKRNGNVIECELCQDLVKKRINILQKEIKQYITTNQYRQDKKNIMSSFFPKQLNSIKFVSAKDYIFPLIFRRIKKFSNSNVNDSNFKFRLSKMCNIKEFQQELNSHL